MINIVTIRKYGGTTYNLQFRCTQIRESKTGGGYQMVAVRLPRIHIRIVVRMLNLTESFHRG